MSEIDYDSDGTVSLQVRYYSVALMILDVRP